MKNRVLTCTHASWFLSVLAWILIRLTELSFPLESVRLRRSGCIWAGIDVRLMTRFYDQFSSIPILIWIVIDVH